ncbi:MAG: hypothetical protein NTV79_10815, partial [Candidatus Aureabacteria bacterium]|nr:hypothetical protein [Candidatus Auribacterota bacterium]
SNLEKCRSELENAGEEVTRRFGNRLSPLLISRSEFLKKRKRKDAFLGNVLKQAEVIFGNTIPELIAHER